MDKEQLPALLVLEPAKDHSRGRYLVVVMNAMELDDVVGMDGGVISGLSWIAMRCWPNGGDPTMNVHPASDGDFANNFCLQMAVASERWSFYWQSK
jgi:hypothetical protein